MKKLIENWKFNKSLLASKMGMSKMTFGNKLKSDSFSNKEIIQLKMILRELYLELDKVLDIDFDDAMNVIVNK
jgi:hypothetical protein